VTTAELPALSATGHEGHRAGTAAYRRVVVALFAAGLATFALLYSTQAVLPDLAADFGVSPAASTLSVSLTTVGLGLALLVAGPVSDLYGRTRLVHLSLAASALVALACALAPTWGVLLGLRLLAGIVLAGLPAVATAYLREELHPSTHARAAGLYIGGTALGGMVGRLLTGGVAELAGWRWALAAAALVGVACAVAVYFLLPPSRGFVPAPTGLRPTLAMARRAVSDPALLKLYAIAGCSMGAMVAVFNAIGFRLESAPFHLGLGAASLVFLVYPLGSLSSVLAGRAADAYGRRAVLPVGVAVAVLGVVVTLAPSLPVLVIGLGLFVIGFFAVHGVASGWVPARAHAGAVSTGQAASLYLFTYYLGSSVFGSLGGTAWAHLSWAGVVGLAAVLLVVSGLLGLSLRRTPILAQR
jgi:MFS transporter, YNFM family, putative membrane transport protein